MRLTLAALLVLIGCSSRPLEGPITAEQSLTRFQLDPTLRIELFASEPFVRDPIDLAFDEQGRAFVAEMLDYPFDPEPGSIPLSRIRLLTDANRDGRIDGAVVFADSIRQITGLQPWNGGLIVTAAPDILYLRDRDGDGRADERRVLFTGFSLANPQHRVSSPRFAMDNWIYVANDGQPGTIRAVDFAEVVAESGGPSVADDPVSFLGADFRFRMDRGQYEPASGPAQYGQTFDDRGNRFIMHNTVHVRHVVLPREYLARNPFLAARPTAREISDHGLEVYQTSLPEEWRISRTTIRSRRYEEENLGRTEHLQGAFTGVSGGAVYTAGALPAQFRGNLFVGEVAANAIHRDILEPAGPTFVARRPPEESSREFLASTDPWFRPCTITVGPDGALYVVDMYREIIESPEFIPEAVRAQLDFYSGTERGRIYRIVARDAPAAAPEKWPGSATVAELIGMLDHPNQWMRLASQRLLVERRDTAAAAVLREAARGHATWQGRLHALYVLESLNALEQGLIADALQSRAPGVREHALRFVSEHSGLATQIISLAGGDPDARVRFQAVLSLGGLDSPEAVSALAGVAASDANDPWFSTAVLTAAPELHAKILEQLIDEGRFFAAVDPGEPKLLQEIAAVIGARGSAEEIEWVLARLEDELSAAEWRRAGLSGLAAGAELAGLRRLDFPQGTVDLTALLDRGGLMISDWSQAAAEAVNEALPVEQRGRAARRLVSARFEDVRRPLEAILLESPELQAIALEVLSQFPRPEIADILLANFDRLTEREAAIQVLTRRQPWARRLLRAVELGIVPADAVEWQSRLRLLENPDPAIRTQAAAILPADLHLDIQPDSVFVKPGIADNGRAVFYARCAVCHLGWNALGPDLAGVSNKGADQLLEAILEPSRAIPGTYESYVALLTDESIVSGRIVAESPGTLTFRGLAGERTVLRSRVRAIRQSSRSLMPDNAAANLTAQELADLISFLRAAPE